jgi:two-component system CitB family sensor kinase
VVARRPGKRSLWRRLLIFQLATVALIVAVGAAVSVLTARERATDAQRLRVLSIAESVAESGDVQAALDDSDPSRALQPLAERIRRRTGVAFVVIMRPDGIRYTHPNPARIGERFIGDIAPARAGHAFTETRTGTLGPSLRSVVPVWRGRRVAALVSVGVLRERIAAEARHQLPALLGFAAAGLLLGVALSALLARRVKRQTLGLEPREITALYEHHDATLHAIREGVLVVDRSGRLMLANDEARRLLGLPPAPAGDREPLERSLDDPALRGLVSSREPVRDAVHLRDDRVLVVNTSPALVDGRPVGTVATLRDRTELQSVLRELDAVRGMADSLRAHAHEAANRLHTIVGLVELGRYEEAIQFATHEVAVAQDLLQSLQQRIAEPALVALLLGKTAAARERGIELEIDPATSLSESGLPPTELVTIVGNLIDNALEALAGTSDGRVEVLVAELDGDVVIEIRDNGAGLPAEDPEQVFEPGWSTKAGTGRPDRGLGLALVRQAAERLGGGATACNDDGAVFTVRVPAKVAAP